jgi:hypothetical protein
MSQHDPVVRREQILSSLQKHYTLAIFFNPTGKAL